MRIGVDARLTYYNQTGIGRYVRGLLHGLAELHSSEEFIVFQLKYDRADLTKDEGFITRRSWAVPRVTGEGMMLHWEFRRQRLNVFHATDFFVPAKPAVPLVFTVHDLYFLKDRQAMDARSFAHYRKNGKYIGNASVVICDSESTRRDLLSLTSIDESRTRVIYPGIDTSDYASTCDSCPKEGSLPEKFLLMVGTIEPRKNLERTLSAYARVVQHYGNDAPSLVIAGKPGFRATEILAPLEQAPLRERVLVLGQVGEDQLRALYRRASALLYPSLYEGFGFPVLEAMAAGIPVITSQVSSLPEVGGEAAWYVDPLSAESIERGIERIIEDAALRVELIEKGKRRWALFSWKNTAGATLEAYRQAGGG